MVFSYIQAENPDWFSPPPFSEAKSQGPVLRIAFVDIDGTLLDREGCRINNTQIYSILNFMARNGWLIIPNTHASSLGSRHAGMLSPQGRVVANLVEILRISDCSISPDDYAERDEGGIFIGDKADYLDLLSKLLLFPEPFSPEQHPVLPPGYEHVDSRKFNAAMYAIFVKHAPILIEKLSQSDASQPLAVEFLMVDDNDLVCRRFAEQQPLSVTVGWKTGEDEPLEQRELAIYPHVIPVDALTSVGIFRSDSDDSYGDPRRNLRVMGGSYLYKLAATCGFHAHVVQKVLADEALLPTEQLYFEWMMSFSSPEEEHIQLPNVRVGRLFDGPIRSDIAYPGEAELEASHQAAVDALCG